MDTFVKAYEELITGPGATLLSTEDVQLMLDDESYFLVQRESPDANAFDNALKRSFAEFPEIIEEERIYLDGKFKEKLQEISERTRCKDETRRSDQRKSTN